jgi:hypothetical protein
MVAIKMKYIGPFKAVYLSLSDGLNNSDLELHILLKAGPAIGLNAIIIKYRINKNSMSANPKIMTHTK